MRTCTIMGLMLAAASVATAQVKPGFTGKSAYCYYNSDTHTWRLGNDVVERTIQFDPATNGLHTVRFLNKPAGAARVVPISMLEGEITMSNPEKPGSKDVLRLDSDWFYNWQTVSTPAHGGRLLTIHLFGQGRNKGYELEALYEIWPGNRPFVGRSVNIINHTDSPRVVERVLFDRWVLAPMENAIPKSTTTGKVNPIVLTKPVAVTAKPVEFRGLEPGVHTLVEPGFAHGLLTAVWDGVPDVTFENGAVVLAVRSGATVGGRAGRFFSPKCVIAPYLGDSATGFALWKRFRGETVSRTAGK